MSICGAEKKNATIQEKEFGNPKLCVSKTPTSTCLQLVCLYGVNRTEVQLCQNTQPLMDNWANHALYAPKVSKEFVSLRKLNTSVTFRANFPKPAFHEIFIHLSSRRSTLGLTGAYLSPGVWRCCGPVRPSCCSWGRWRRARREVWWRWSCSADSRSEVAASTRPSTVDPCC